MNFDPTMVQPLREKMGLSREDFAREIYVGSRAVHHWETGKVTRINRAVRENLVRLHEKYMTE